MQRLELVRGRWDGLTAELIDAQGFGDASDQTMSAVATDATGHVFVAAQVSGTIDFGNGPLTGSDGGLAIAKLAP